MISLLGVVACTSSPPPPLPNTGPAAQKLDKVGLMLPLSGRNSGLGQEMLNAAKLALADTPAITLDVYDTTSKSGDQLAQSAITASDRLVLGPLTSAETKKVADGVMGANIPVIAYTSDVAQARPGVWVMGITPEQQVSRLVRAAKAEGRKKLAAFLPDNRFGHALGDALMVAASDEGFPSPQIVYHTQSPDSINNTMKMLAEYDLRKQNAQDAATPALPKPPPAADEASPPKDKPEAGKTASAKPDTSADLLDELMPKAQAKKTADSGTADSAQKLSLAAPSFDVLLLGDIGAQLQKTIDAMAKYQVRSKDVRVIGPGLWAAFANKLGALQGAWYAAPNQALRQEFVQKYKAKYQHPPKPLADLAYDTAALAKILARKESFSIADLTKPAGFAGVDGVFVLNPDGHVKRELSVFEIQPGGGSKIKSAAPGS